MFQVCTITRITLFPIFSNSVMWNPYHILAHLSYLFHLIPNILLSSSAIFFPAPFQLFLLNLFYLRVCECVIHSVFVRLMATILLFSSYVWSNNISFIFYVNFIRFDVIKKPFSERFYRYPKLKWPDFLNNTFLFSGNIKFVRETLNVRIFVYPQKTKVIILVI